jgi:hypothetical protein
MTKKDFFIVLIKVFGLYATLVSLFSIVPRMFSYAGAGFDALSLIWILLSGLVVVGLFVGLLFKAEAVVRLLRLERGFDEERIDLGRLSGLAIIKISLLIIGATLVIDQVPAFLSHSYYAFKADLRGQDYDSEDNFNWLLSSLELILGLTLVTQFDRIAVFLMRKEEGDDK